MKVLFSFVNMFLCSFYIHYILFITKLANCKDVYQKMKVWANSSPFLFCLEINCHCENLLTVRAKPIIILLSHFTGCCAAGAHTTFASGIYMDILLNEKYFLCFLKTFALNNNHFQLFWTPDVIIHDLVSFNKPEILNEVGALGKYLEMI